jgi:hypothetical protein
MPSSSASTGPALPDAGIALGLGLANECNEERYKRDGTSKNTEDKQNS